MRRLALSLFAVVLLTAGAALAGGVPPSNSPVYGRTVCQPSFQCPSGLDSDTARLLANMVLQKAENCVVNNFGVTNEGGFFESSMGLDYNLCLSTKELPRRKVGLTVVPRCCVKQSGDGVCQLICERVGIQ